MPFNTLEQDRRNRIGDSSLSPLELGLSSSPTSDVPASQHPETFFTSSSTCRTRLYGRLGWSSVVVLVTYQNPGRENFFFSPEEDASGVGDDLTCWRVNDGQILSFY